MRTAAAIAACLIAAGCKRESVEIPKPVPEQAPAQLVLYNPLDCPLVDDEGRQLRASLYASGGPQKPTRACLYAREGAPPAQGPRRIEPSH